MAFSHAALSSEAAGSCDDLTQLLTSEHFAYKLRTDFTKTL